MKHRPSSPVPACAWRAMDFAIHSTIFKLFLFVSMLSYCQHSFAQNLKLDPAFNAADVGDGAGQGFNNTVEASAVQPDGKVIVGGVFNTFNLRSVPRVVRLETDGTLDETFNAGVQTPPEVGKIILQPDGKVLVSGSFGSTGGGPSYGIVRLNADGTKDSTFYTAGGPNGTITDMLLLQDGKILICGNFLQVQGVPRMRVARLNSDGLLDSTFIPEGTGPGSGMRAMAVQSDGKIVIGGFFTSFNGVPHNYLARMHADGRLDTTFSIGTGLDSYVFALAVQPDDKVIVGGSFTSYNGTTKHGVMRINPDGTLDTGFDHPGNDAGGPVLNITYDSINNKVYIGGGVTHYGGSSRNGIARINSDGTLDTSFSPGSGANSYSETISLYADGKIFVGGSFTTFAGNPEGRCSRLNSNGSLDTSFNPGGSGANSSVHAVAVQSDGKVLIGGTFTGYNGQSSPYFIRLNVDGTEDTSFAVTPGGPVYAIALEPDGQIIVGGDFTTFNGSNASRLARLNTDGTLDATFDSGVGAQGGDVYSILVQPDGKIIIGGTFTAYKGQIRSRIARLNSNASLDATFAPGVGFNAAVNALKLQADGKILAGGLFATFNSVARSRIARVNPDGTLDTTFNPGAGANGAIHALATLSDGRVVVGGNFTQYNNISRNRIARINADGSLDDSFSPGLNQIVYSIEAFAEKRVLVGGLFTSVNGFRNRLVGFDSLGVTTELLDAGTGTNGAVRAIVDAGDGKIMIGGDFTAFNGSGKTRIARLYTLEQQTVEGFDSFTATYGDSAVTYPATASSGLTVAYGSSNDSIASFSGSTLTLVGAGNATITATHPGDDQYAPLNLTRTVTINRKPLTIEGVTITSKEYDGTAMASATEGTLAGVVDGDDISLVQGTATFSDKHAGNNKTVTFSGYAIMGADTANYSLEQPADTVANIAKIPALVAGALVSNKIYDGTTVAQKTDAMLSGIIDGDDVTLVQGEAHFADKNIGVNKAVTFSNYVLVGADSANYYYGQPAPTTASIYPLEITIAVDSAQSKVYGDPDPSLTYILSPAPVEGDSLTGHLERAPGDTVGTYPIHQGTLALDSNYQVTFHGADFTIYPRELTLVGYNASDKEYDATTDVSYQSGTMNGVLDGESVSLVEGTVRFADKHAGTGKTLVFDGFSITGVHSANYTLTLPALQATISQRPASITGLTPLTRSYDGTTIAPFEGGTLNGTIEGDEVSIGPGTGTFADKNAGTGKIVSFAGFSLTGADAANYALTPPSDTTGTIEPKALTISATAWQSKIYGDADPELMYDVAGLVPGDSLLGGLQRDAGEDAGEYPINIGTLSAGANYSQTFESNTFYILQKELSLTHLEAEDKTYDGTTTATLVVGDLSGVLPGDDVGFTNPAGEFGQKDALPDQIVFVSNLTLTGSDAHNYSISYPSELTASIKPKSLQLAGLLAEDKEYDGGTDAVLSFESLAGIVDNDDVGVGIIAAYFEHADAGLEKTVVIDTVSLEGSDASNYMLETPASLTATIYPAVIDVSPDAGQNKIYGDPEPVLNYTANAVLKPGNEFSGSLTREVGEDAGEYVIYQGTLSAGANYEINFNAGQTFVIAARNLQIDGLEAEDKIFDGTITATFSGGALIGVLENDVVHIGEIHGSFADKHAADNKPVVLAEIVLTGDDAHNYHIGALPQLTASISPMPIAITPDANQGKTFGETDPLLTYTSTPALLADDTFTGTLSREPGENAGNYAITPGTLSAGPDYSLEFNAGSFEIGKAPQTIEFELGFTTKSGSDPDFAVTATSTAGLPITFSILSGPAQVLNGNTIHLNGTAGVVEVQASQTGNENYLAALPVTRSFEVEVITDVEETSFDRHLAVFPNPANDVVTVESPVSPILKLALVDVHGKLIMEQRFQGLQQVSLNVSDIASGKFIFLVIETQKGKTGKKIMIIR